MKMKKKFSDEEYSGQDSVNLEEESDKTVKKRMGRKEHRLRKREQEQIIRIEELEKIMGEMGEDVDPETIVSMYMPRRRAKRF